MTNFAVTSEVSQEFLRKLEDASRRTLTAKEQYEQKVSFIYGSVSSSTGSITKENIRKAISSI